MEILAWIALLVGLAFMAGASAGVGAGGARRPAPVARARRRRAVPRVGPEATPEIGPDRAMP